MLLGNWQAQEKKTSQNYGEKLNLTKKSISVCTKIFSALKLSYSWSCLIKLGCFTLHQNQKVCPIQNWDCKRHDKIIVYLSVYMSKCNCQASRSAKSIETLHDNSSLIKVTLVQGRCCSLKVTSKKNVQLTVDTRL